MRYFIGIIGLIIVISIAISIISWALKNIVGLLGFGIAIWGIYEWNKNKKLGAKSKVPAAIVVVGVIIGFSWFAFAPETPKPVENTPPAATESQPTAQQSAYQQKPTTSPKQVTDATSADQEEDQRAPVSLMAAQVTKVVDGDTVYVRLPNGSEEKVRFIGVNTPESTIQHEPYGQEASNYTKSKLSGKTVYLEKDVSERDKYNRLLRYIWLDKPGEISDIEIRSKMFNAILLLGGYAQVATYPPDVRYVDYFTKYQQEAREASKGLWGIEVTEAEPEPTPSQTVSTETFVGSANSNKYHYPDCRWAKKISPANLVEFKSAQEARNAGYVPCKVCSPP